jgi:predicted ATPase
MKRLANVRVQGFRSLATADLHELGPVSVLIGPNGSGKSNLLSALRMVSLMTTQSLGRFTQEAGGASALLHNGPGVTREMSLRLEFEQSEEPPEHPSEPGTAYARPPDAPGPPVPEPPPESGPRPAKRPLILPSRSLLRSTPRPPQWNVYEARLGYAAGDRLFILAESAGTRIGGTEEYQWFEIGGGYDESRIDAGANDGPTIKTTRWLLQRLNFYHFHDTSRTSLLRANSRVEDRKYLRSNGSNLGAYLLALRESEQGEDRGAYRRIGDLVRQVAPFIKALDPSEVGDGTVQLLWSDRRDDTFGPHHLSDGTLRLIALFTALAQPVSRLPLFCSIDEPELGLHPAALHLLCELVRSTSAHCQVMLSTQSPDLLDHFDASEVWVVEQPAGESAFTRQDPKALEAWLADYKLSELYHSNLLGGRP